MFRNQIKLFKLLGFQVKADASWFLILLIIIWSLSFAYFPVIYEDLSISSYIIMGIAGALGLFLSIVLHEYSHALVAKRHGVHIKGITLWVFGGIADLANEPTDPKKEFYIAIAGPITSAVIAGFCYMIALLTPESFIYVNGVFTYLWKINLILLIFNLIPAFPLDGGRILRSLLWEWKGKLAWATRISSNIGSGIGVVLMFLGVLAFLSGDLVVGVWYFFIGLFIRWAAKMTYTRMRINQTLEGEKISNFMSDVVSLQSDVSLSHSIQNYFYKYKKPLFPVTNPNGDIVGVLLADSVKTVDVNKRGSTEVAEIMKKDKSLFTVGADEDAAKVMSRLAKNKYRSFIVVEKNVPVGSINLSDLIDIISLKLQMDGEEDSIVPDMRISSNPI